MRVPGTLYECNMHCRTWPSLEKMVELYLIRMNPDPNPYPDRLGKFSEFSRNEDVMRSECGLSTIHPKLGWRI